MEEKKQQFFPHRKNRPWIFLPQDYDKRIVLGNQARQVCFKALKNDQEQQTLEERKGEYKKMSSQRGKEFLNLKQQLLNKDNEAIRAVLLANNPSKFVVSYTPKRDFFSNRPSQ